MKLHIVKDMFGLHPFTEVDEEIIDAMTNGFYDCELKRPRNAKYHRKFFGMLKFVYMSQEAIQDFDEFRDELLIKAGYCSTFYMVVQGENITVKKPRSISFSSCDQIQFEVLYNKVVDVILADYIHGESKEEFENKVMAILSYT